MQALANMNEEDVNGWPGSCCYIDGYLCSVLFLHIFTLILVSGRAAHSKSTMIVVFFAVNTLPIAFKCIHGEYVQREAHSEHIL